MSMKTRVTELLGIEVPVVQGAMARIADASLAGAVSEAGGLGIIACGGAPLDWVEEQVRIARSITDKPIGANVMLMDPNAGETAELLAKLRVDVITTGAGSPANYMQLWKDAGIKVVPVVASSALAASGMLSDEATFALVKARSELMAEAAAAHPGVMSALLKADEDVVAALCEQCAEGEVLVPANFNCPGQIVIAGAPAAVERAEAAWAEAGKRSSRLATSGAFHSPLMADAAAGLAAYLENVEFSEARIPLVCNVTAAPLSAADARENLVRHLTSPVRFDASVAALTAAGADMFVEVGFGGVLANLVKRIDKTATRACVQDRASFDGCLAVASATDSE